MASQQGSGRDNATSWLLASCYKRELPPHIETCSRPRSRSHPGLPVLCRRGANPSGAARARHAWRLLLIWGQPRVH